MLTLIIKQDGAAARSHMADGGPGHPMSEDMSRFLGILGERYLLVAWAELVLMFPGREGHLFLLPPCARVGRVSQHLKCLEESCWKTVTVTAASVKLRELEPRVHPGVCSGFGIPSSLHLDLWCLFS